MQLLELLPMANFHAQVRVTLKISLCVNSISETLDILLFRLRALV